MSDETTKRPRAGDLIDKGLREEQFDNPFAGGDSDEARRAATEEAANRARNRAWRESLDQLLAGAEDDSTGCEEGRPTHQELYARGTRKLDEPTEVPEPVLNPPGTLSRNLALLRTDEAQ